MLTADLLLELAVALAVVVVVLAIPLLMGVNREIVYAPCVFRSS